MKLGTKRRNTADGTLSVKMPPLLIFVQVFTYQDANGRPKRTTFVVLSLTNDKTGWGIAEVEKLVYESPKGINIMKHCKHHQHWSDHGGSFPSEEVAGWVLSKLLAHPEFKKLETVELNIWCVP